MLEAFKKEGNQDIRLLGDGYQDNSISVKQTIHALRLVISILRR